MTTALLTSEVFYSLNNNLLGGGMINIKPILSSLVMIGSVFLLSGCSTASVNMTKGVGSKSRTVGAVGDIKIKIDDSGRYTAEKDGIEFPACTRDCSAFKRQIALMGITSTKAKLNRREAVVTVVDFQANKFGAVDMPADAKKYREKKKYSDITSPELHLSSADKSIQVAVLDDDLASSGASLGVLPLLAQIGPTVDTGSPWQCGAAKPPQANGCCSLRLLVFGGYRVEVPNSHDPDCWNE